MQRRVGYECLLSSSLGQRFVPDKRVMLWLTGWTSIQPFLVGRVRKSQRGQNLDGSDLSELLQKHPRNPDLVKDKNGKPRNSMIWHFSHGVAQQSTIRIDGWKLIKNWMPGRPKYELYQLHGDSTKKNSRRAKGIVPQNRGHGKKESTSKKPTTWLKKCLAKSREMSKELYSRLNAMNVILSV